MNLSLEPEIRIYIGYQYKEHELHDLIEAILEKIVGIGPFIIETLSVEAPEESARQ